jgi:hypothetical protein
MQLLSEDGADEHIVDCNNYDRRVVVQVVKIASHFLCLLDAIQDNIYRIIGLATSSHEFSCTYMKSRFLTSLLREWSPCSHGAD